MRKYCSYLFACLFACKFDAEGLRFEIVTGGFNQNYFFTFYIGTIRILAGTIEGVKTYEKKLEKIFTTYLGFKPGIFLGSNNLELQDNLFQKLNGASSPE